MRHLRQYIYLRQSLNNCRRNQVLTYALNRSWENHGDVLWLDAPGHHGSLVKNYTKIFIFEQIIVCFAEKRYAENPRVNQYPVSMMRSDNGVSKWWCFQWRFQAVKFPGNDISRQWCFQVIVDPNNCVSRRIYFRTMIHPGYAPSRIGYFQNLVCAELTKIEKNNASPWKG